MRILIAHVRYRQRGGEDVVVETEAALLRDAGHDVELLDPSSEEFDSLPFATKLQIGMSAGDHRYGHGLMRQAILAHRPDVVHFHNLYPLLGPGAIAEAARLGCATVQTLHNYRLSCVAGTHFRDGAVCEECSPGRHWHGIRHACYRSSVLQSAAMARSVSTQWQLAHGARAPHVLLCLTEFMRSRLIDAGVPGDALIVKPNGVPGSTRRVPYKDRSGVVFVGRLSAEKGILPLLEGWEEAYPHLTIAGTGPLEEQIRRIVAHRSNVSCVGALGHDEVRAEIASSRAMVLPSVCYEGGLPLVALEALAEGTPVVGFAYGASLSLEDAGEGLLVELGGFDSLRQTASMVAHADEAAWGTLSRRCGEEHAERYELSRSLLGLESAYATAVTCAAGGC